MKSTGLLLKVACILASLGCLAALVACDEKTQPAASAAEPGTARSLKGGDQSAWLTDRGDYGDSGYCNASLALPLDQAFSWEKSYTNAEFSTDPVQEMTHYDGTVIITARSAMVMGIDVQTGKTVANVRISGSEDIPAQVEDLRRLNLTEDGLVTCKDGKGYVFCWDLDQGLDGKCWGYDSNDSMGAIVSGGDKVFFAREGSMLALDKGNGNETWNSPVLHTWGGIVLSDAGTLVCWPSNRHNVLALDSTSGALRWAYYAEDRVELVNIDNWRNRALVWLNGERVVALDLETGATAWEYSWSWLVNGGQRQELNDLYREQTRQDPERDMPDVKVRVSAPMAGPEGIAVALISGDVLALTPDGKLQWHFKAQAETDTAVMFNNGILVRAIWRDPASHQAYLYPLTTTVPDWDIITRTREAEAQAAAPDGQTARRARAFCRIMVLNLEDGTVLSAFEPEFYALSSLVPAQDKVIYGEAPQDYVYRFAGRESFPKRVLAYDWLVLDSADSQGGQ